MLPANIGVQSFRTRSHVGDGAAPVCFASDSSFRDFLAKSLINVMEQACP